MLLAHTQTLTTYRANELDDVIAVNKDLLNGYTNQLDTSEATKRTYTACIKIFLKWLDDNGRVNVSYEVLVTYKNYMKTKYKARAINTHITALKDFFKYLERLGFNNVAKGLKKERVSNEFAKDSLTTEQVKSIINNIDVSTEEGARANALFRLLIGTGIRECEAVRANVGDIRNKGNKTVLYIQGKGETERNKYVVLCNSVITALNNYFSFRTELKDSTPLFTSCSDRNNGQRLSTRTIQRIVKGLYGSNGINNPRITTHSTRHTAVTLSILNGANVQQAQAMARHKNINTTMIYYHDLNRLEDNAEEKIDNLFN